MSLTTPDATPGPPEDERPEALGRAVGSGFRWSLASRVGGRVVNFLSGVVIARLLVPEDFGVYAVALAAMNLLMTINDLGLIPGIVQWKGRFRDIAPTATALTLGASIVFYAGAFLGAPAFTSVMGSPQAVGIIRLLTIEILVDGVTAVPVARLLRTFRQDRLAIAEMVGLPVTVVTTILLALAGAGPWALAWGHLAGTVVTAVLVLVLARTFVRPRLDRAVARDVLSFCLPLAAGFLVEAALLNADYLVVGRVLGPTALGFYLLAFNISTWPIGLVREAIRRVSIAGFSQVIKDGGDLTSSFREPFRLVVLASLPLAVMLGVFAPALIDFVYGSTWSGSAAPLRFLAVLALVRLAAVLVVDVQLASGRSRLSLAFQVAWAVALLPALYLGATVDGIRGVAVAHAVVGLVVALPFGLVTLRTVGLRVGEVLRPLARPIAAAAVAGLAVAPVAALVSPPLLQVLVGGTVLVYVPAAVPRRDLAAVVAAVRAAVRRRRGRRGAGAGT